MNIVNLEGHLIGRFWFKKTQNGNLIGEFSNSSSDEISSESADNQLINSSKDFQGKYKSTWQEKGEHLISDLIIMLKQNTITNIYSLEWRDLDGDIIYIGEGIIVDNILIGDYRDFKIA